MDNFNDATFQQALARARASEAAEIAFIAAGGIVPQYRDIGEMLREQAYERMARIF